MGDPEAPATAASTGPASSAATSGAPSDGGLPVAVGDVIADKYRVDRYLGRGGVGIVVQATHLRLNQRVAIKLLLSTAMHDSVARFLREAQAAVRLKSEHVARVLDVGELPNGAPYMVMEFLEGSDLDELLHKRGAQPIQDSVHYVLDACEAMAEAHAAGIVHRDLKPANLFLTTGADGGKSIKVLDFGISKDGGLTDPTQSGMKLTQTTAVFGSPLYMSPEQMRSARLADARSDIWALGVILYELVTGHPPFDAEMYPDLVFKVNMEAPPPPSSHRREIPPKLEAAILRCLEKDPSKRFQDVGKLAAAIAPFGPPEARVAAERVQRVLGASRTSMPSFADAGAEVSGTTLSKTDGPWAASHARSARPKTGLLVGVVAVSAAAVFGIGAILFFTRSRDPEPETREITPATDNQTAVATDSSPEPNGIRVVPATEASPQAPSPPPSAQVPSSTAAPPADPRKTAGPPTSVAAPPPASPTAAPPEPGPTPKAAGPAETRPQPSQPGNPPPASSESNRNSFDMKLK